MECLTNTPSCLRLYTTASEAEGAKGLMKDDYEDM